MTATCTLASGSVFNEGKTDIICTATDAMTRTAQCAFSVTVSVVPRLRGSKIVAFGDSMTAGEVSEPFDANVRYLDVENSYPSVLGRLLAERYRGQELAVVNEGCPGERVVFPGAPCGGGESGEDRVETVVLRHRPDVLIVLEGVNGLITKADATAIGEGLRRAVRRAVRDGVQLVLVSTILPGAAQGTKPPNPELVQALNDEIRSWVGREGAVLIDSYAAFQGNEMALIGKDGLHPNLDGYRKLADIFFTALVQHFEAPPPESGPADPSRSVLAAHGHGRRAAGR